MVFFYSEFILVFICLFNFYWIFIDVNGIMIFFIAPIVVKILGFTWIETDME
jgi:hypothetical protein